MESLLLLDNKTNQIFSFLIVIIFYYDRIHLFTWFVLGLENKTRTSLSKTCVVIMSVQVFWTELLGAQLLSNYIVVTDSLTHSHGTFSLFFYISVVVRFRHSLQVCYLEFDNEVIYDVFMSHYLTQMAHWTVSLILHADYCFEVYFKLEQVKVKCLKSSV